MNNREGTPFKNSHDHMLITALLSKDKDRSGIEKVKEKILDKLPKSDVIAANIRGLEKPEEPENGKFKYTDCLGGNTRLRNELCTHIKFDISRYGKHTHTLVFDKAMTINQAIKKAEEYLSEPLTEEYYNNIKDDLFNCEGWEEDKKYFKCRGNCLTDAKFLENVTWHDGVPIIECGS